MTAPHTRRCALFRSVFSAFSICALFATGLLLTVVSCSHRAAAGDARVIILGFDGMDYGIVDRMMAEGRLPNLTRLAGSGVFAPLGTSIPPQSPVAWSNFITGMDSGGHGIFDFIHRDPETLMPYPSTVRIEDSTRVLKIGKWQVPLAGGTIEPLRRGTPFWEVLEDHGVETTVIRMPANFPPSGTATRELSGMGTQDLVGTDGTYSFYTSELFAFAGEELTGGNVYELDVYDNVVQAQLYGPDNPFLTEPEKLSQKFTVYLDPDQDAAAIVLGDQEFVLAVGEWSEWAKVEFEMIPTQTLHGIARFYLRQITPEFELYVTPIDIDPMTPAMPISTPDSFAAELAEATGPFYTEGMPEDTKLLTDGNDGVMEPSEFLMQAGFAGQEVVDQYYWVLDQYLTSYSGLLFYYFGNLDQISHVMTRSTDPEHPAFDAERDGPYSEVIQEIYEELDGVVGHTLDRIDDRTLLIVMSDHGFTSWRRAFHLNTWLKENGYLAVKDPDPYSDPGYLLRVDWNRTKAYAYGFSGLYINLEGRERDGIVPPEQLDSLLAEIAAKLLATIDPATGEPAVTEAHLSSNYEDHDALDIGPDIVVGYAKGTRSSTDSALGKIGPQVITDNEGAWSGDHIMDHRSVPGVLFANRPLEKPAERLQDLAAAVVAEFGIEEFPPGD